LEVEHAPAKAQKQIDDNTVSNTAAATTLDDLACVHTDGARRRGVVFAWKSIVPLRLHRVDTLRRVTNVPMTS